MLLHVVSGVLMNECCSVLYMHRRLIVLAVRVCMCVFKYILMHVSASYLMYVVTSILF